MESSSIAAIVATFSSIGFLVFFGVGTITPAAWQIISQQKLKQIFDNPVLRFMAIFIKMRWVLLFFIIAFFYLLAGLLVMVFILFPDYSRLLDLSVCFITGDLLLTLTTFIAILIRIQMVPIAEIKELSQYLPP